MPGELKEQLDAAAFAVRAAAEILAPHVALMEQFEQESRDLESIGPVLAPGLFLRVQRELWRADIRDAYQAAVRFAREFERISGRHADRAERRRALHPDSPNE